MLCACLIFRITIIIMVCVCFSLTFSKVQCKSITWTGNRAWFWKKQHRRVYQQQQCWTCHIYCAYCRKQLRNLIDACSGHIFLKTFCCPFFFSWTDTFSNHQPIPQHLFPRLCSRISHVFWRSHFFSFLSHVIIARHACRVFTSSLPPASPPYITADTFCKCKGVRISLTYTSFLTSR